MKKGPNNLPAAWASGEQLTLLDAPPFCPGWPQRNTLADRALKLLLDGRALDHPDFIDGAGSWRLAAVVFQLRTLGWPIETIDASRPSEENPSRSIALYRLPAKAAAEVLVTGVQRPA